MSIVVCVTGGRTYSNVRNVRDYLDGIHASRGVARVVTGAATGADAIAEKWAIDNAVPCTQFPANWKRYKKAAGPMRNIQMLRTAQPDLLLAFPGGRGTLHCVETARAMGIAVLHGTEDVA